MRAFFVAAVFLFVSAALPNRAYAADPPGGSFAKDKNGCQFWNPDSSPSPSLEVRWSGGCQDGWMEGSGALEMVVDGKVVETWRATLRRGYAEGPGTVVRSGDGPASTVAVDGAWAIEVREGCWTYNPQPQPDETARWSGECRNGWMDGYGTLEWSHSGTVSGRATGTYRNRGWDGFVSAQLFRDGKPFEDQDQEWRNGTCRYMSVRSSDGTRMTGEASGTASCVFDGLGVLTSIDGSRYEGGFKDGAKHGFGTWTESNGARTQGIVENNLFHGPVVKSFPSGTRLEVVLTHGKVMEESPCRQTAASGDSYAGKMMLKSDGVNYCTQGFWRSASEFLLASAQGINFAMAAQGKAPLINFDDPYAGVTQMLAWQASAIQARNNEVQQRRAQATEGQGMASKDAEIAMLKQQLALANGQLAQAPSPSASSGYAAAPAPGSNSTTTSTIAPRTVPSSQPNYAAAGAPTRQELPSNCISDVAESALNGTNVTMDNACNVQLRVNICARFKDDLGTRTQSTLIDANSRGRFEFVDPERRAFQYLFKYCSSNDACPSSCP